MQEEFDMEAGVDSIAAGLGLGIEPTQEDEVDESETELSIEEPSEEQPEIEASDDSVVAEPTQQQEDEVEAKTEKVEVDYPKSWPKEMKASWDKLPQDIRKVVSDQELLRKKQTLEGMELYKADAKYGKDFKYILQPYKKVIEESGVTETQAIQHLMNAHVRLSYGSKEARMAAYQELGRTLGLDAPVTTNASIGQPLETNPELKSIQEELSQVKQTLTYRQQQEEAATKAKLQSEVDEFASQNPYFDEVAEDVAIYIKGGLQLKEAYERAVWANPVTRQKEQIRLQAESQAELKKKAAAEASKALKTKSSNINNRHTKSVPTEPKGKMFDDMEEQLAAIKNRH